MLLNLWCTDCSNTGWRELHRQGDPVPQAPGCIYASTVRVTCGCRTTLFPVTPIPWEPSAPAGV